MIACSWLCCPTQDLQQHQKELASQRDSLKELRKIQHEEQLTHVSRMKELQRLCNAEIARQQQAVKQQQKTLQLQEQQSMKSIAERQQQSMKQFTLQQESLKELHRQQHAWLDVQVKQHSVATAAAAQRYQPALQPTLDVGSPSNDSNSDSFHSTALLSNLSPAQLQLYAVPASTMMTGSERKQLRSHMQHQLQHQLQQPRTPPPRVAAQSRPRSPFTAPAASKRSGLSHSVSSPLSLHSSSSAVPFLMAPEQNSADLPSFHSPPASI